MRLGQLSRKLDIKPTEIREFLRQEFKIEIDLDLNTRIEDHHAEAVSAKFEKKVEPVPVIRKTTSEIKTEVLNQPDPILESTQEQEITEEHIVHSPIEIPHYHEATQHTEEILAQENTSENKDAFIPLPVNPDAELIKVPKIKLEGLKVVGKIELPTKKEKEEIVPVQVEGNETTSEVNAENIAIPEIKSEKSGLGKPERKSKPVPLQNNDDEEYSIFKDKRGIYHFSQTQRENRKNSLERIQREKLEELRKKKKVKHYQSLVDTEKKTESPKVKAKKQAQRESKKQSEKPVRKGIWGKFLNWLNG